MAEAMSDSFYLLRDLLVLLISRGRALQQDEPQHLEAVRYNYTDASKKLGISRSTLWRKIKDFGIETF